MLAKSDECHGSKKKFDGIFWSTFLLCQAAPSRPEAKAKSNSAYRAFWPIWPGLQINVWNHDLSVLEFLSHGFPEANTKSRAYIITKRRVSVRWKLMAVNSSRHLPWKRTFLRNVAVLLCRLDRVQGDHFIRREKCHDAAVRYSGSVHSLLIVSCLSRVYMAASEAIGRDMLLKGQCIGQVRAVMAFASISWVVVQSQQSSVWTHDTTPTSSCLVPVPSSRCSSPWWRNCWLKLKAWHVLYSSCFDPPPFFDIEWPHLTLMLWMCRWKVAFWACQSRATGWAGRWGGTSPKVCGRGRWIFGWGWPDYHDSHADQPDPEDEKMDPHDVTYIWSWLLHAMMQRKSDNVRTARQKRALRFKFARQFLLDFEIWKHNNWHWLIWSEWFFFKTKMEWKQWPNLRLMLEIH